MQIPLKQNLLVLSLGLFLLLGRAYADSVDANQLKAAFIFKFAQFTTWTSSPLGDNFTICLLGGHPFGEAFEIVQGKSLEGKPVAVKYLDSADSIAQCQVAYLNPGNRKELLEWIGKIDSLPILTVSDYPDASKENVMIEFTTEPNRVTFKVNLSAARKSDLGLSARVLQLAQEIL